MQEVPYPCRVWDREGMSCPPGYHDLLEDEEDDDDDDDDDSDPLDKPWIWVARRLKDGGSGTAVTAVDLAEVMAEVRAILDKQRVLQRATWAQLPLFNYPHIQDTRGSKWNKVALAAVVVLAGYGFYRAGSAIGRAPRSTRFVASAAMIVAPFLAGLESEPRTLNFVPAFAYNQYAERRRRRLEEEVSGRPGAESLHEEPPGGGAPDPYTHYLWYDPTIPGRLSNGLLRGFIIGRVKNPAALALLFWVIKGRSEQEVLDELLRLSQNEFDIWYKQLVKENSPDPIGADNTGTTGSDDRLDGTTPEVVDESVPMGNRW